MIFYDLVVSCLMWLLLFRIHVNLFPVPNEGVALFIGTVFDVTFSCFQRFMPHHISNIYRTGTALIKICCLRDTEVMAHDVA
jgi:hypothetical protein